MLEQALEKDIEGIGDEDITPIGKKYAENQRRLVTQKMDLFIPSLKDMLRNQVIDLDPIFQRRDRWTKAQQSKLIESIIMGVPIPPVFLAEEKYGNYSVMDGKQRLSAINSYLNDEYNLVGLTFWDELNGKKYSKLDGTIQSAINRRYISAIVILKESDLEIKFDVFERINTGGERLNPQEIRNCIYRGEFNNLLIGLSENDVFRQSLGLPVSKEEAQKTRVYKQMEDVQLVLRFFALQNYEKISGNLKTSLNKFMEDRANLPHQEMDQYRNLFINTIYKVYNVYKGLSFHKWDPTNNEWGPISAPLYDAVMYSFSKIDAKSIEGKENLIIENTKKLFENPLFVDSIRKGTNSIEANKTRMTLFLQMLNESIGV